MNGSASASPLSSALLQRAPAIHASWRCRGCRGCLTHSADFIVMILLYIWYPSVFALAGSFGSFPPPSPIFSSASGVGDFLRLERPSVRINEGSTPSLFFLVLTEGVPLSGASTLSPRSSGDSVGWAFFAALPALCLAGVIVDMGMTSESSRRGMRGWMQGRGREEGGNVDKRSQRVFSFQHSARASPLWAIHTQWQSAASSRCSLTAS